MHSITKPANPTKTGNAKKYDTKHEGVAGWRIDKFDTNAAKALSKSPTDIILLCVGMQDIKDNYLLNEAMARYEKLLKSLRSTSQEAEIVVGTLIDSRNATYQGRIDVFDEALRKLVAAQNSVYGDVSLAEMSGILEKTKDYNNDTTPNDKGYAKVAIEWNKALSNISMIPNATKLAIPPIRIMALGSSSTYGTGSSATNFNAGYRGYLQQDMDAKGILYDMVGSLRQGAQDSIDTDNEGHYGYRIDQIASGVKNWLTDNPPDVVILIAGANDLAQNYNIAAAPQRLSDLIDLIRTYAPAGVKILVCTMFDYAAATMQGRATQFNTSVRSVVSKQFSTYGDVYLCDLEGVINAATDHYDSLHPNPAGYRKIATKIETSLAPIIPGM